MLHKIRVGLKVMALPVLGISALVAALAAVGVYLGVTAFYLALWLAGALVIAYFVGDLNATSEETHHREMVKRRESRP